MFQIMALEVNIIFVVFLFFSYFTWIILKILIIATRRAALLKEISWFFEVTLLRICDNDNPYVIFKSNYFPWGNVVYVFITSYRIAYEFSNTSKSLSSLLR